MHSVLIFKIAFCHIILHLTKIHFRKKVEEIRSEMIEELKASVIHMIHTPDGARAGLHCVWFGSAKDRKLILKTIKEFLVKVSQIIGIKARKNWCLEYL